MQATMADLNDASPPLEDSFDSNALFHELVQAHQKRLYRFIIKSIGNIHDAEDLTQQAFVEAVKSYRSFRGSSELSTWLYGIAMNLVRNHLSRSPHLRYEFCSEDELQELPSRTLAPDELASQAEQVQHLREAMYGLPESMQAVLILVGIEGLSYEEAAQLLTVPVGTVRSRVSRARASLRKEMIARGVEL